MKRNLLLMGIAILCSSAVFSQNSTRNVVASAGGSSSTSEYTFDWTLGEIAGETVSNQSYLFTQGFHQPYLSVKSLNTSATEEITVMPNPVQSDLKIVFKTMERGKVQVMVTNEAGQQVLVRTADIIHGLITINVSSFARGVYFLAVKNEQSGLIGSFKIIKN